MRPKPKQPNNSIKRVESEADFAKLRSKWYAKLKSSGFTDIEWTTEANGADVYSPYTTGSDSAKAGNASFKSFEQNLCHFLLCDNFLAHTYPDRPKITKKQLFILQKHAQGLSYRQIIKAWNATQLADRFGTISLRSIHRQMQLIQDVVYSWNRKSPFGRLREVDKSEYLDALLRTGSEPPSQ